MDSTCGLNHYPTCSLWLTGFIRNRDSRLSEALTTSCAWSLVLPFPIDVRERKPATRLEAKEAFTDSTKPLRLAKCPPPVMGSEHGGNRCWCQYVAAYTYGLRPGSPI